MVSSSAHDAGTSTVQAPSRSPSSHQEVTYKVEVAQRGATSPSRQSHLLQEGRSLRSPTSGPAADTPLSVVGVGQQQRVNKQVSYQSSPQQAVATSSARPSSHAAPPPEGPARATLQRAGSGTYLVQDARPFTEPSPAVHLAVLGSRVQIEERPPPPPPPSSRAWRAGSGTATTMTTTTTTRRTVAVVQAAETRTSEPASVFQSSRPVQRQASAGGGEEQGVAWTQQSAALSSAASGPERRQPQDLSALVTMKPFQSRSEGRTAAIARFNPAEQSVAPDVEEAEATDCPWAGTGGAQRATEREGRRWGPPR